MTVRKERDLPKATAGGLAGNRGDPIRVRRRRNADDR